jgi:glycosyltransferase involved in cell wall biosynthesis
MAQELTEGGIEADYWIIGGDVHGNGYGKFLEHRVCELGLRERVTFLGHCANVPALLQQSDVVVSSSHVEPFGICLIEAMACEKPVVATRVGGIPEVVDDEKTGILIPPRRPADMAKAVKRFLDDPALRQEMGRAGRKRVERLFTAEVHADKVLASYQEVLGRIEGA